MILFANHAARALFPHDSAEGSYLTLCRDANYIQVVEQALDGNGAHGKLERNGRIYELTASSVAVSYTHLDVYKRQFFLCALTSIFAVVLICIFLFANGVPAMKEIGLLDFLTGARCV